MDFVGTGFSVRDSDVKLGAISYLVWTNGAVSLCKCIFYTNRCCPCSASCSFMEVPGSTCRRKCRLLVKQRWSTWPILVTCLHRGLCWETALPSSIWISKQNIIQKKSFLEHFSEVNHDLACVGSQGGRCCSTVLSCLVTWVDMRETFPLTPIEIYQNAAAKTLPAVLQYKELEFCGMGGLGSHLFLKQ